MANNSIKDAFSRFWQHTLGKLDNYATIESLDTHISNTSNPHGVTKAQVGLGNVDNTADANKNVKYAATAGSSTKSTQDASGNVITTTYETKADASDKLEEAKSYADSVGEDVKNDLLNGAGGAYDTLKELGDLIDDNKDAIDALKTIASDKADASHKHAASDITSGTLSSDRLPTVPISKGGTGATTRKAAITNLTELGVNPNGSIENDTVEFWKSQGTGIAWYRDTNLLHGQPSQYGFLLNLIVNGGEIWQFWKSSGNNNLSYRSGNSTIGLPTTWVRVIDSANIGSQSVAEATKATKDGSNNTITSTYATKTELNTAKSDLQGSIDSMAAQTSLDSHTGNTTIHITAPERTNWNGKLESSDISTGSTNGAISVDGKDIAVKGLAEAAYKGVDTALSSTSTNLVTNKAITTAINEASSAISANTSSINAHTEAIEELQGDFSEIQAITIADIQSLFSA